MLFRIFIAISLPEQIKKKLIIFSQKWPELKGSIRWLKKEALHFTLLFLGPLTEREILKVSQIIKKITQFQKPFFLKFKKICYGPRKIIPPRLIWTELEESPELLKLVKILKNEINKAEVLKRIEKREFLPHVSLARIKTWQWQRVEAEERPNIEEEFNLSFRVDSIQIMESKLKKAGAEYTILENFPFVNQ